MTCTRCPIHSGKRRLVAEHQMNDRHLDGWKFDFARACITAVVYAIFVFGMSRSFLYGGGIEGIFPLLAGLFLGSWPAAWITCKLLPSQRRRIVTRLACGIYAGCFVCWALLGLTSVLLPKWPDSDPRIRFMARHDAELVIIPFCMFFVLGPLVLSRWRSTVRGSVNAYLTRQ